MKLWRFLVAVTAVVAMTFVSAGVVGLIHPAQAQQSADTTLSELTLSAGTLSPAFSRFQTEYSAFAGNSVSTVDVIATVNDPGATLTIDGSVATSGAATTVSLSEGDNTIAIVVTSKDGATTRTYTVSMYRASTADFAYKVDDDLDLHSDNGSSYGVWSDGTTMWVVDRSDRKLYAYTLASGARDTSSEFNLYYENNGPTGIWSDGTTMWVADTSDRKLYAYTLASGARDTSSEFNLHSDNDSFYGIWSDGTTMWVARGVRGKLYSYNMPGSASSLGAPTVGTVTPGVGSLAISWTAPSSDGGSAISAYDLRHIETSADETVDSNWTVVDDVWTTGGGTLQYTVTGLTGGTQYDLQVRAVNSGGDGPWSATATGTPAAATTTPTDYDADDDGLIEVGSLAQLDAIRYDLDGDGSSTDSTAYDAAFPNAATGMGCPSAGCTGYELTTNLDFDTNGNGEADAGDDYWNDGAGWEPIDGDGSGYQNQYFHATFEGNSHMISGLYIDRSGNVGFFGSVWGGEIRNLGLEGVVVKGGDGIGDNTGGLVGSTHSSLSNPSLISGSYVTGSVSGRTSVGGLVGFNQAAINASYVSVSVSGNVNIGGLVGTNHSSGSISASYATGSVTGGAGYGGGLVGSNQSGSINASYATSSLSGRFMGGLVGVDSGGRGVFAASYWDTETSGQSTSAGGEGKTTSELQSPTGYTGIYANWNVDLDDDGTGDDPWDFGTSSDYPNLKVVGPVSASLGAPTIGTVTPGTGSLAISWTAPSSDGGSAITAYDLRHIETSADETDDSNWTVVDDVWTTGGGTLEYTLTGLNGGTQYDLQMRAVNAAGDGPWSATSTGTPTAQTARSTTQNDRDILIALYNATDGANWSDNTNWLSDEPLGDWFGVTTDINGRVTSLNIWLNNLTGAIPSQLGSLSNLTALELTGNQLTGSIPAELGNLSNLESLALGSNDLTGNIPSELGSLSNLTGLSLSSNDLTGTIPSELGSLSNLTSLSLGRNDLTGAIPSQLGSLSNLESLWLGDNQLTGAIPAELGSLSNLDYLGLEGNGLTGAIPTELGNLSSLTWLALNGNQLTGALPQSFTNLAAVDDFAFSDNDGLCAPTDAAFQTWLQGISNSNMTIEIAVPFGPNCVSSELTDREILIALYNATDGANWTNNTNWLSDEPLGNWHGVTTDADGRVTRLALSSNNLAGTIPAELGSLSNLTELSLSSNPKLTGTIPTLNWVTCLDLDVAVPSKANELTGAVPPLS